MSETPQQPAPDDFDRLQWEMDHFLHGSEYEDYAAAHPEVYAQNAARHSHLMTILGKIAHPRRNQNN